MTVRPDSTSYPTLAVIHEFGITDEEERRLIWTWSGLIADNRWRRPFSQNVDQADLLRELDDRFGYRMPLLRERLLDNIQRAIDWCMDQL